MTLPHHWSGNGLFVLLSYLYRWTWTTDIRLAHCPWYLPEHIWMECPFSHISHWNLHSNGGHFDLAWLIIWLCIPTNVIPRCAWYILQQMCPVYVTFIEPFHSQIAREWKPTNDTRQGNLDEWQYAHQLTIQSTNADARLKRMKHKKTHPASHTSHNKGVF